MRHRKAGRKFGRQSDQRHALIGGLVTNLVRYERIQTTDAKAKELRRYVERVITWGTSVAELVDREPESLAEHERARIIHAMRMARRTVRDREALHKLFHDLAPRYLGRPGGYTRIIKIGSRHGDAATLSYIELLPAEAEPEHEAVEKGQGKGKGQKGKAAETGGREKASEKKEAPAQTRAAKGKGQGAKAAAPSKKLEKQSKKKREEE